jgi:hypothetical protein
MNLEVLKRNKSSNNKGRVKNKFDEGKMISTKWDFKNSK